MLHCSVSVVRYLGAFPFLFSNRVLSGRRYLLIVDHVGGQTHPTWAITSESIWLADAPPNAPEDRRYGRFISTGYEASQCPLVQTPHWAQRHRCFQTNGFSRLAAGPCTLLGFAFALFFLTTPVLLYSPSPLPPAMRKDVPFYAVNCTGAKLPLAMSCLVFLYFPFFLLVVCGSLIRPLSNMRLLSPK